MPSAEHITMAAGNFDAAYNNPYLGRVVGVGVDDTAQFVVRVCATMGRSEGSRGRVYLSDGNGRVWTDPLDPKKRDDPNTHNTLYTAMDQGRDGAWQYVAVSNGDHTGTIMAELAEGGSFYDALLSRQHEDDAYNTPRIAGICLLNSEGVIAELAILKKSAFGDGCDRQFFSYDHMEPGLGWFIHTYHEGDPSKAFAGEPFVLPLIGGIDSVTEKLWGMLNEENRVSLAISFTDISTGATTVRIMNKYEQLTAAE